MKASILAFIVITVRSASITIMTLVVAACGAAQNGNRRGPAATENGGPCRAFVQTFYDWYVPLALKDNKDPAWELALKAKPNAFSVGLTRLLKQDTEAQRKASKSTGELVGLDFDPFLNSQDPSERFVVEKVTFQGVACSVEVRGISSGQKRETVVPEVRCKKGQCQFVNFHYSYGDHPDDLLNILASPR